MRNTISRICLDGTYAPEERPDIPIQVDQFVINPEEWISLGNVLDYSVENNVLTLNVVEEKVIRFYFLSKSIFRIRFNVSGDYKMDNSYAIINYFGEGIPIAVDDFADILSVNTGELTVTIKKSPYSVTVDADDKQICIDYGRNLAWYKDEMTQTYRMINYKKSNQGARYYGFGEKTGNLNKKGTSMTNWNYDAYGYGFDSDPLYLGIPFFVEVNRQGFTYGIFFDNPSQTFYDMGYSDTNSYYFGSQSAEMNYYFIYGRGIKDIIQRYTDLTGRIPMPPKYVLGFQQSRFS